MSDFDVLLDTCAVIPWCYDRLPEALGMIESPLVSTITVQEVWTGALRPPLPRDPAQKRQAQWEARTLDLRSRVIPFGRVDARIMAELRQAFLNEARKDNRVYADLMIASTALAAGLPLATYNVADFKRLHDDLVIVDLEAM